MSIYEQYVSEDCLISPINGYTCKRINRQNIKQFGFNSIKELHEKFPDFPLICDKLYQKYLTHTKNSEKFISHIENTKKENEKQRKIKLEKEYNTYRENPKKCLKCNNNIPFEKRNNNYCSRKCSNSRIWTEEDKLKKSKAYKNSEKCAAQVENQKEKFKKTMIDIICYCGKKNIKVSPNTYNSEKSYSCSNEVCKKTLKTMNMRKSGKASAAKRCKRSKLEVKLFNLLCNYFDNITHNDPIANGWDADILLHDYKIAILWNGPWHYKEMGFSNHSLSQVVNRDCIKIMEFEKIGWSVIIYEDNVWTPETAMIDIIFNIKSGRG